MKKRPFRPFLLLERAQKPVENIIPVKILAAPRPDIPDEIMQRELTGATNTADLWALFTVFPDNHADVMLLSSTGSAVLDDYGIRATRRWRFRAARKGDAYDLLHPPAHRVLSRVFSMTCRTPEHRKS